MLSPAAKDSYYFVSNSDLNILRKTKNEKHIEMVSDDLIEAIDVDLK